MGKFKPTRHRILNVARIVFGTLSVNKTTMDDIAKASKLGRRTLYTYYKSKDELYAAVVSDEINNLMKDFRILVNGRLSPQIKLERYFRQRFKSMQNLLDRNPSLKNDYVNRSERIDHIRKELDKEELFLVNQILEDGKKLGNFKVKDINNLSFIILTTLKGMERQFILQDFDPKCTEIIETLYSTIFNGIKTTQSN